MKTLKEKLSYCCFRIIRGLVWLFYPKVTAEGTENLPDEPCLVVGNHSQLHGPISCELYFPGNQYTWCAGQMMHWKDVPAYAFQDFWSGKPKKTHWFYRILSYLITPLSVCVFNNAKTIGVYRDSRIISTFKNTVKRLQEGANVIVFPECYDEHNHIVHAFQTNFLDVAKLYHKRTGKALKIVPLYIAPNLRKMYLGKATQYCPDAPAAEERQRICDYLMDAITEIACSLPRHTVVPYNNIPKSQYPQNLSSEEHAE